MNMMKKISGFLELKWASCEFYKIDEQMKCLLKLRWIILNN
jgi:hypothetical protein